MRATTRSRCALYSKSKQSIVEFVTEMRAYLEEEDFVAAEGRP